MTAKPLKGRALARRLRRRTAKDVREFQERTGHAATIAAVMVGDDQGALNYARAQSRASGNTGIGYRLVRLPGDCRMADAMEAIDRLNLAAEITGIILLTPRADPSESDYAAMANCTFERFGRRVARQHGPPARRYRHFLHTPDPSCRNGPAGQPGP